MRSGLTQGPQLHFSWLLLGPLPQHPIAGKIVLHKRKSGDRLRVPPTVSHIFCASEKFQFHCGCLAVTARFEFVRNFLVFVDRRESGLLNSRDVYEYVFVAVIWLNKPIPLGGVEPLDCTSRHVFLLSGVLTPVFNATRTPCARYQIVIGESSVTSSSVAGSRPYAPKQIR